MEISTSPMVIAQRKNLNSPSVQVRNKKKSTWNIIFRHLNLFTQNAIC